MNYSHKKKNKFIKNTICSLYEAENFLQNYNNISDILHLLKIVKKHQPCKKPHNHCL